MNRDRYLGLEITIAQHQPPVECEWDAVAGNYLLRRKYATEYKDGKRLKEEIRRFTSMSALADYLGVGPNGETPSNVNVYDTRKHKR